VKLGSAFAASGSLLAEAQGILGASVVSGVAYYPLGVTGSAVTYRFYDGEGNLMGSCLTNPSLGPVGNRPIWRNAEGTILSS